MLHLAFCILTLLGLYLYLRFYRGWGSLFQENCVRPPQPLVTDKRVRDKVLRQGFSQDKVPPNLDVVVIGSGIGGLSVAALLAKAGKKVLVLEQHDQAGGSCHTFEQHGYEFDVGIHYLGQMHEAGMLRVIMDQLTEGQLQWNRLEDPYDSIILGPNQYHLSSGKTEFANTLKKQFPGEEEAIEKFMTLVKKVALHVPLLAILKMLPHFLSLLLLRSGLLYRLSPVFRLAESSYQDVVSNLTSNKDLQSVFSYLFYGDLLKQLNGHKLFYVRPFKREPTVGVPPSDSSFVINALLLHHYKRGAWYPKGGSSEIAFHIIPVIQRAGGRVLVRAPVTRILMSNGRATGVAVKRSGKETCIYAPIIISDAGIFNTYERLLPPEIRTAPEVLSILSSLQYGMGCFLVFVGLRGTSKELGLKSMNHWIYQEGDVSNLMERYPSMEFDKVCENVPLMFITFPSAKDPTYSQRHPGRACMTILTMAPYHWFSQWSENQPRHRGDEYHSMKMRLAERMLERALQEYPQLKDKVDYMEAATPVSNEYYLRAPKGSMYGAEQNRGRYQCEIISRIRAQSVIPGLYLTGQDVFSSGLTGAVHGGLICACAVLNRILYVDLLILKKRLKSQRRMKKS